MVHLTTAAIGAEAFYTRANNSARREGLEEARRLDAATQHAWVGHPYFHVLPNAGVLDFDDKMNRLIQAQLRPNHRSERGRSFPGGV